MARAAVATPETATFDVVAPRTGVVVASVPTMGGEQVARTVRAARAAQAGWAARSPRDRMRAISALARVLERRSDEIVERLVAETGKPESEALAEIAVSIDLIAFYRAVAPGHLRRRRVSSGWMLWKGAWVEPEPWGVVGAITPWNYPLILAMDTVTAGLAAGNAVVVKPSEFAPLTTLMVPELAREAGIPDGVVGVVTGGASTGEALVRSGVDKISFTGSTDVGRKVMATAAESLTPVTMELGGKDAAIVLADADLERAARGIVFGAFFNAGQTCISVERVYVERGVSDALTDRIVAATRALRSGASGTLDVGPMITEPQREKVVAQLEDAVAKGARVLTGGVPSDGARVVPPTVLVDVDETMVVYRDETFGPVLPIVPVSDESEAIRRANAAEYGLCASVWTGDRRRGRRVARALRAGCVSINDVLSHYGVASLPMGGVGASGFGRRRGLAGLDEMVRVRSILEDRLGLRREPWWFPYGPASERLGRAVLVWRARGGVGGALAALRAMLTR